MSIAFQCKSCGKKLKAPDSAAGTTSTCPGCGAKVTCPQAAQDDVAEMGPPPGFNPFADLDDDKPHGASQSPPAQDASTESRPCPMCGEMIVANAIKCRFCGEVFDAPSKKAKGKKKTKKSGPDEETLSTAEIVLAVLCSGIGCIAGIIWMVQGKPKGKKMFSLSIAMVVVWNVVRYVAQQSMQK